MTEKSDGKTTGVGIYDLLKADFPQGAYSIDNSRGFVLTGIRVAFVVERLTIVFGLVGAGWRYSHSPFEIVDKEVLTEIVLQYRVDDKEGCPPYVWSNDAKQFVPNGTNESWSEPIYATGGNRLGSGGVPMADARKSAVSAGLSKAASMLGVGQNAYKGKLEIDGNKIVVKEDQEPEQDDATVTLNRALGALFVEAPEVYSKILKVSRAAKVWHQAMLANFSDIITEANLVEFVSDNVNAIFGRQVNGLGELTSTELLYLSGMIKSIQSGDISWEDALVAANSWDKKSRWLFEPQPEEAKDGDDS